MLASDGYLYGTTYGGGANGTGTVFKLSSSGAESILYSFAVNGGAGGVRGFRSAGLPWIAAATSGGQLLTAATTITETARCSRYQLREPNLSIALLLRRLLESYPVQH